MLRDLLIAEAFRQGATLQEIGTEYGITRERVRQVLKKRFGLVREHGGQAMRSLLNAKQRLDAETQRQERMERRCLRRWGLTRAEYTAHVAAHGNTATRRSPMAKFTDQRNSARKRGIGWEMTFADWWRVWQESGRWDERGPGTGYCMARYGDDGPYSVDNVYICTIGQNFADSYLVDHPGRRKSRGFCVHTYRVKSGRRYMVSFPTGAKRYFGGFASNDEAVRFATQHLSSQAHTERSRYDRPAAQATPSV